MGGRWVRCGGPLDLGPEPGPEPGPEQEGRRGQPISIAILGFWEPRHKETPTTSVELPLATRLLSVLVCAQSYSSNSRPGRQQKHIDGDPTIITLHVCHPCIDVDRPAIDATDTAVDQGACLLRACQSRASRLLRCRFGRTPCNAPSPPSGTREGLISSHIPSHPSHHIPTLSHPPSHPLASHCTHHHTRRLVRMFMANGTRERG